MPDSPLSQADLEEALKQALDELMMVGVGYRARPMPAEDYVLVEAAMAALRAALSAPEGERWGVEERPDWMPPVEQQPDQVEAVARALRSAPRRWERMAEAAIAAYEGSRSGSAGGEDQRRIAELERALAAAQPKVDWQAQMAQDAARIEELEDQRLTPLTINEYRGIIDWLQDDAPRWIADKLRALAGSVEEDQRETEFQRRARKGGELIDRARRENQRLTTEQWKVVLDAATHYDRRLPQGQGSPEIEAALRALAGSVGEPDA